MKKTLLFLASIALAFSLAGCSSKKKTSGKTKERIVVAKMETPVKHLYFSGTIQPIKTVPVLSPVDGRIQELNFKFGENIKKGQLIAIVNSLKLMDSFRSAVSSFLTKKTAYLTQAQNFQGAKVLYKAGVISEQDYQTEESSYENSVLDYFQEEYQLKKVLLKAGVKPETIEKLSISDTSKIKQLFAKQFNHIRVYAPNSGVALFPVPSLSQGSDSGNNASNTSDSGAIVVGSAVREAQLILSIGDLDGFAIDMNINEVNINSIKLGMHAMITGNAFPGVNLQGDVSYVASQAQPNQGGDESGGSVFKVSVTVPKVTKKDLQTVHVGMTAKIDIPIKGQPHIMLPINAVFKKNNASYVTVVDATGKRQDVAVVTGNTTPMQVVILSGVKAGQKVVVRDQV